MALTSTIRFRPFSHDSGTMCQLAGSSLALQLFAGRMLVFDYSVENPCLIASVVFLNLGPLEQCTVLQDLEAGKIVVSGFAKTGFMRYTIIAQQDPKSWILHFDKLPHELEIAVDEKIMKASQGQNIVFGVEGVKTFAPRERLFLGVDKSQEWPQVLRRCIMPEVLPYIYWLSQSVVLPKIATNPGISLLKNLQDAIIEKKRAEVLEHFKALFIAGFGHQLMPRLEDTSYHGYQEPVVADVNQSPLMLLAELKSQIRSLFFQEHEDGFSILPLLPPECSCGTFCDIVTKKGHKVSIEWTKHLVRRVQIIGACDDEITLSFQKEITGFRLERHAFSAPAKLKIRPAHMYLLYNFQK